MFFIKGFQFFLSVEIFISILFSLIVNAEYFGSKYVRTGSIYTEVDEDGNCTWTAGKIGDATVYFGFGKDKYGNHGCVFFAELPDGNVITGHIPDSNAHDSLYIEDAFLSIYPVK